MTLMWLGSLYGAIFRINAASLFALGFISMFVSGGVSAFPGAASSTSCCTPPIRGRPFPHGDGRGVHFRCLAGTYFWFGKMTGRMMNETLGQLHFWLTFIGTYCIFMPFHYLGLVGNVRRYSAFVNDYTGPLLPLHKFITIAALGTGAAQLIFIFNLIYSRYKVRLLRKTRGTERRSSEYSFASTLEQFRRQTSRDLPRPISV